MGWQGTWEIAAAGGVSVGWDQENPIANIPFLGVCVGSQKSEDSRESTPTRRGGRPKGTKWKDRTEEGMRDHLLSDWRNGTDEASKRISRLIEQDPADTLYSTEQKQRQRLQALQKKTQRYLHDLHKEKFRWTSPPSITEIKQLMQDEKI